MTTLAACPECDSSNIHRMKSPPYRYSCNVCDGVFFEPVERPPKRLADRLERMAPSLEVP